MKPIVLQQNGLNDVATIIKPQLMLSPDKRQVGIIGEYLHPEDFSETGITLRLTLPTEDAMVLLALLQGMQQKHSLPLPSGSVDGFVPPPKNRTN